MLEIKIKHSAFVLIAVFFLLLGFILGLFVQQAAFKESLIAIASSVEGMELNIDLNETEMVDRMYEHFEKEGYLREETKPLRGEPDWIVQNRTTLSEPGWLE